MQRLNASVRINNGCLRRVNVDEELYFLLETPGSTIPASGARRETASGICPNSSSQTGQHDSLNARAKCMAKAFLLLCLETEVIFIIAQMIDVPIRSSEHMAVTALQQQGSWFFLRSTSRATFLTWALRLDVVLALT
jgi:hypothetical protein